MISCWKFPYPNRILTKQHESAEDELFIANII